MTSRTTDRIGLVGGQASLVVGCTGHSWNIRLGRSERTYSTTWSGLRRATALVHRWSRLQRRPSARALRDMFILDVEAHGLLPVEVEEILMLALRDEAASNNDLTTLLDGEFRSPLRTPPIVFSAPFLREVHLVRDVLTYRAAAIAVERYENAFDPHRRMLDWTNNFSTVERHVEALKNWRELFVAAGSRRRSVNITLDTLGAVAAPDALCALAKVPLERPVSTCRHLDVLAERVRLPADKATSSDLLLLQRASEDELIECLAVTNRALAKTASTGVEASHDLAVVLHQYSDHGTHRTTLRGRVQAALQRAGECWVELQKPVVPPIPLPEHPGIRFLTSATEIQEEGARMHHCIGSLVENALAGHSYFFSVEHEGMEATVEVTAEGRVAQAFGPANTVNAASKWGRMALGRWSKRLRHRGGSRP